MVPDWLYEEEFMWRYRTHFGLSVEQYENEPYPAIQQARLKWSLEDERAKLKSKGQ